MLFVRFLRFYVLRLSTDGLRRPYLSLHDERYGRKACLVVASSTSFVLPLVAKAQSLRCSSFPHRTHFVGLRRGPIFKLLPRTRLYCNTCDKNVGTLRITCLIYSRQSGGCVNLSFLLGTRSTQRQGDKRSAAADVIASNAPLRNGSHKARQNGPKHYPGDPTGAAAPLVCLSPLSFFKQRKMGPPEVVRLAERQVKTYSERWSPRRAFVSQSAQ